MPNASDAGVTAATTTTTTEEEKPLTRADILALLTESLPGVVNAAVTNHAKRLQKDFDKKLAAFAPVPKPEGEGEAEGVERAEADPKAPKAGAAAGTTATVTAVADARYAELEKKLAKLTKDNEASQRAAAAERRARLESDGYASVTKALTGKTRAGAESMLVDLWKGRGNIAIDDHGAVRLRLRTDGEPEDGLDLSEGIASYMKTTEWPTWAPVPTTPARRPPLSGPSGGQRSSSAGSQPDPIANFEAKHGKLSDAL